MIIDTVANHKLYPYGEAWDKAFAFLRTLTPDSEEKKYAIQGDDIFAIVMSYETTTEDNAILESHQKYIDVQSVIVGAETFECFFTENLSVRTPYDASKDVAFYHMLSCGHTRVTVTPQSFVMLYPNDAHMAGLVVEGRAEMVKKVVVKIRANLLSKQDHLL